jgi:two-component system response regulator YesN
MYNVLVLDDEILIRKSIITKLNKSSFSLGKVVEAGNSKQALETLNDTKFDILITDIRMGGPSGLDFIEELKKISPWTKSIIISGYEEFSYASRAISLGVVDYLLKPINTNELLVSVV